MQVVIAGGGIGGLAAALALAPAGHAVTVCEQAAAFGEVGAGIQISPNAGRVLHHLGIGEAYEAIATRPEHIVLRRWDDDRVLRRTPLGDGFAARYGHHYTNAARPDLVAVLEAAVAAAGTIDVRFGAKVVGADPGNEGSAPAVAHLADGGALEADVVVGADGIHSAVRTSVFGPQPSRFSGSVAYRALVPRHRVPHLPVEVTNRMGPDRHVVSYFVGAQQQHLNLVCIGPEATWDVESWTEPGSVDKLRAQYRGWSAELATVLEQVDAPVFRWALHDREPLSQWSVGRVTLLGDACHPMLPYMAQGACQAIEDAAVLTRCLDGVRGSNRAAVHTALCRYEQARRPRTATVQTLSWRNRMVYHLADGPEQAARDESFAQQQADPGAMDWLYGADPLTAPLG